MTKIKKILSNLLLIFAVVIIIYCIYIAIKSRNTNEELFIFGCKPYIIQTGSMEPDFQVNSLIIVKKGNYNEIKAGDVISFKSPGIEKNVCHRVVRIEDGKFITKGDNNQHEDSGYVTESDYVGKVVLTTNITSFFMNGIQTPIGKLKIILPIIAIILLVVSIKIFRNKNNKKIL